MRNLLEYLDKSAERVPERIAIRMKEEAYTFAGLREKSAQLGRILRSLVPDGGKPVGVIANRTAETGLLFLAVLASGNYYVPIDPDLPEVKLRTIIEDAGFSVIIGNAANREKLECAGFSEIFKTAEELSGTSEKEEEPSETVRAADEIFAASVEEEAPREAGNDLAGSFSEGNPEVLNDAPAYMIYTSGSTGKPKGVLKSHGAVVSFIEAYCGTFDFGDDEVIGNQTPFFFDASAKDFYLMLKKGITLEILPTELFKMPKLLVEYMNERRVTFASWVPTALSIVAQLGTFKSVLPQYLRKVFFVGEVMPMKHLNKWRAALPDVKYVNLYGATELAGICCYYEVEGKFDDAASLPMGRALPNCRLYLLPQAGEAENAKNAAASERDSRSEQGTGEETSERTAVPAEEIITEPGKVGELYLVSDALALEYYHDREKTASSFLMKDFGEGPVRCFKTGDLAQYDADGNLVFATRADFQIKHMGHRIELGEIETVAGALPQIQRCCCTYDKVRSKIVLYCELAADADAADTDAGSDIPVGDAPSGGAQEAESIVQKQEEKGPVLSASDSKQAAQEIKLLLRDRLSSYMQPSKVVIMEHLPLNANGKIDRKALG